MAERRSTTAEEKPGCRCSLQRFGGGGGSSDIQRRDRQQQQQRLPVLRPLSPPSSSSSCRDHHVRRRPRHHFFGSFSFPTRRRMPALPLAVVLTPAAMLLLHFAPVVTRASDEVPSLGQSVESAIGNVDIDTLIAVYLGDGCEALEDSAAAFSESNGADETFDGKFIDDIEVETPFTDPLFGQNSNGVAQPEKQRQLPQERPPHKRLPTTRKRLEQPLQQHPQPQPPPKRQQMSTTNTERCFWQPSSTNLSPASIATTAAAGATPYAHYDSSVLGSTTTTVLGSTTTTDCVSQDGTRFRKYTSRRFSSKDEFIGGLSDDGASYLLLLFWVV